MFEYIIILLLVLIILLTLLTNDNKTDNKETIQILVRQASRWSVAATQDMNPMIALLHANYGAGYLWALRDIATDDEIYDATGIDVIKFKNEITKIQDDATIKVAKTCPNFAPQSTYLSGLAGENVMS